MQTGLVNTPKAESISLVSPDDGDCVSVLLECHLMIGKQFICLRLAPSLDAAKYAHVDFIAGVGIGLNGTPICMHDQLSSCAHLKLFIDVPVVFCFANSRPDTNQETREKTCPGRNLWF